MRKIIVSCYLYGKGEFCAALQWELLWTEQCVSVTPCQDTTVTDHRPGVWRKSGPLRKVVEGGKLLTFKRYLVVVLQELIAYSRLVSSKEGQQLSQKDGRHNSGETTEGDKLGYLQPESMGSI